MIGVGDIDAATYPERLQIVETASEDVAEGEGAVLDALYAVAGDADVARGIDVATRIGGEDLGGPVVVAGVTGEDRARPPIQRGPAVALHQLGSVTSGTFDEAQPPLSFRFLQHVLRAVHATSWSRAVRTRPPTPR